MKNLAPKLAAFLTCCLCLVGTGSLLASDGYVLQRNGYYTYGSEPQMYYRSYETTPGYWRYGCYYAGTSRWVYYAYNAPVAYVAPVIPKYNEPGAIDKLLAIKVNELADQSKADTFARAAESLGFNFKHQYNVGQSRQQQYSGQYSTSGHYYQNYAVGAATQYLYNPVSYGQLDINQLNLMQAQLTQSVQDAAKEGFARHTQTVDNMNAGATKVAEINARTAFAIATLNALSTEPKLQSQGFKFQIDPATASLKMMAPVGADAEAWERDAVAYITSACAGCHSGKKLEGGFDVSTWFVMTQAQRDKIIADRITTPDLTRRMPRNPDRTVGPPVTGKNLLMLRNPTLK